MWLFMHDINNDDVFTRIEDVEAWVLLVKHPNIRNLLMPVTGKGAFLKLLTDRSGVRNVLHAMCQPSDTSSSALFETSQCGCPAFGVTFYATF